MFDKKIIITIDTEVGEGAKSVKDGFEKFVMGKIGDDYYGVPKIVEILNAHHVKGEFFVDVYEDAFFGEEKYATLCRYLDEQGHGVQLHTHPSYAYDINRINMYEYSLEEQIRIILDGKVRIIKWIGKNPIAHRAGNYGANNDTLQALKENHIQYDSSFYYGHPNCRLHLPTINHSYQFNDVTEIPVTVAKFKKKLFHILPYKKNFIKIDVNSLDVQSMINFVQNSKDDYIVLFLHSSSFIIPNRPYYTLIKKNEQLINDFNNLISFFERNKFSVKKISDLLEKTQERASKF